MTFKRDNNNPNWKGGKPRCLVCKKFLVKYGAKHCRNHVLFTKKTRKKLSKARRKEWKLGIRTSEHMFGNVNGFTKGFTPWNKGKHYQAVSGSKNGNWKNGISQQNRTERQNIMSSLEYKTWRKNVFKKDNYTCQDCGQIGGELNADHIKPFALFPKLRFKLSNGRTLCVPCHKKITFSK